MTKDFSNPKKLGFMRVIEVVWILNVFILITSAAFLVKGSFQIGYHDVVEYFNMLTDAVCVMLLIRRKSATRKVAISLSVINIALGYAYFQATTDSITAFATLWWVLTCLGDIIVIVYFKTSRRAKAILTVPLDLETSKIDTSKEDEFFAPKKWPFWRNLAIYFCIFSIVGHWMEAAYCTLIRFGLIPGTYDPNSQIWHDWLYPFAVYGFGAVACVLLLFPIKSFLQKHIKKTYISIALSFVINASVCTIIELIMGLLLNTPPNADGVLPLWDYSNMFCNFMGQICLQNAVAFGVISTLMTWFIYPQLELEISKISKDYMNIIFVIVVVFFIFLNFLYIIKVN